jgi:protein-S-isoprenylcysteine O-methyltransferase Ste14
MNAPASSPAALWVGQALVALQFALLAAMGWRAAHGSTFLLHTPVGALQAAGSAHADAVVGSARGLAPGGLLLAAALLGLWTLTANRPGNFNIRPEPRHGGVLVTHGPYRWVRHPMYTAVLLAAAAAALAAGGVPDALLWAALLAVLWAKADVEERALLGCFADYAGYRGRTWRFLPGLV